MNPESKVPVISLEGPISYENWLKGRRFRREPSKRVAPGIFRCKSSSSDKRPRTLFNGERSLPFTPTDKL